MTMVTADRLMVTTGVRLPVTAIGRGVSLALGTPVHLNSLISDHLTGLNSNPLRPQGRSNESEVRWRGTCRSGLEFGVKLSRKMEPVGRNLKNFHSSISIAFSREPQPTGCEL